MRCPRLQFFLCVWGEYHLNLLLTGCLPSLLARGNFPALADLPETQSDLWIFTTQKHLAALQSSAALKLASNLLSVHYELLDAGQLSCPTKTINRSYGQLMRLQADDDYAIVWLAPDLIWPENTIANLMRIGATGVSLITCPYLRSVDEELLPTLTQHYTDRTQSVLQISTRDLIRLGARTIHPVLTAMCWSTENFTAWPCQLYWPVGEEGFIARYFHAFPFFTRPRCGESPVVESHESIDGGEFLTRSIPQWKESHITTDSDELFCCELVQRSYQVHALTNQGPQIEKVARWAGENAHPVHRHFFNYQVRIHAGDSDPQWREVEQQANQAAAAIQQEFERQTRQALERAHANESRVFTEHLARNQPYFGPLCAARQGIAERYQMMQWLLRNERREHRSAPISILEIGSWAGGSAIVWADALKKFHRGNGSVLCIDPWETYLDPQQGSWYKLMEDAFKDDQIFKLFLHNIKSSQHQDVVRFLRRPSTQALPELPPGSFDLIYVNGDHRYESMLLDLKNSIRLLRPGGVLCGDDLELQLLAVGEILGRVSSWHGFWAVRYDGTNFLPVNLPPMPAGAITLPEFLGPKKRSHRRAW